MSITFSRDGNQLLNLRPLELRRVYSLNTEEDVPTLKYSHTDVIVLLDNDAKAMLDICNGLLEDGRYVLETQPTDQTFDVRLRRSDSLNRLKRIITMAFPSLLTRDYYGAKLIKPYQTQLS